LGEAISGRSRVWRHSLIAFRRPRGRHRRAAARPGGQRDIDAFDRVVESGGVDGDKRKNPAGEFRLGADGLQRRRRRDRIAAVERGLDPCQSSLFRAPDRLLKRIAGRKAAGQIGDDDPVSSFFSPGFDGDGFTHYERPA
jgi:hypothetical protein